MNEERAVRLKRLKMRSARRGIKEMDLILGHYAKARLDAMDGPALDAYERLLDENDHDLYQWVTGQVPPPPAFAGLIGEIAGVALHG
ncbi:MAG: succinate dehydrogenase assembly factor 2 [Rhodobacterales bacterium CG2_30_65_12]|nr:MAG: succinate dehydrogenase assembly factor 2 [Rhodobacterales bacterium CG2_30_65_12]